MSPLFIKSNYLIVSRAAAGIYLILQCEGFSDRKVLVPASLCYAAIYPILYSGNHPVFCDADPEDGNISEEIFMNAVRNDSIDAVILPHMYGNPVQDIDVIADICKARGILLIEDCASSMGSLLKDGSECGKYGDYSIFSTGYSKTVDLGSGGIICSDRPLERLKELYLTLPEQNERGTCNEAFFSKLYRLIRNSKETLSETIWPSLIPAVREIFLHREAGIEDVVTEGIKDLDRIIGERKHNYRLYDSLIEESDSIRKYPLHEGAVPWRYNLFVESNKHRQVIDRLLQKTVPVSDWYPNVTPLFGSKLPFPGVDRMESTLINFPLLIKEEEIVRIAEAVNGLKE